jgi:hypothetical protein
VTVFVNPSVFEIFGMTALNPMAPEMLVVACDLEHRKEQAASGVNCPLLAPREFRPFLDSVEGVILRSDVAML